ncbi:MAG: DUF4382 domain-containing protein [Chloroflexota bacterium]
MRKYLMFVMVCLLAMPVIAQDEVGPVTFTANGEDFVRQGFVSKDGWDISFDNVMVNLEEIRAYQTTPSYNPDDGELVRSDVMIGLPGTYVIDLAAGDADAAPLTVGTVDAAPFGYYNAVGWEMTPATDGDMAGYALQIVGTATRDSDMVDFTLNFGESFKYDCGAFIGDDRLGVLAEGVDGTVEMTFHFDHIFGDAELDPDDSLNTLAPGFEPFAGLAVDGVVTADDAVFEAEMTAEDYQLLVEILPTLGHTGEGHCFEYAG